MDIAEVEQRARDDSHIKLLAVFSFVMAGFSTIGAVFIGLHYLIMHTVFSNPKIIDQMRTQMANQNQSMPFDPQTFFGAFIYFYLFFAAWSLISLVANLAAGFFLLRRTNRVACMVVAGFNCINLPLGTVLGVFTIIVLLRDSVRGRFDSAVMTTNA